MSFTFVPFGVMRRVLEPIPAVYEWRQSTPLNWLVGVFGVLVPCSRGPRCLGTSPRYYVLQTVLPQAMLYCSFIEKWKIVKREWCLKHEFWHLFSRLFAVICIVWSICSSPPSCQITLKMLRKEQYKWDFPSWFYLSVKNHNTSFFSSIFNVYECSSYIWILHNQ